MKYQSLDKPKPNEGADGQAGGEATGEISLQAMNRHQRLPTEERVAYDDDEEEEIDVFSISSADVRGSSPSLLNADVRIPRPHTAANQDGNHHQQQDNNNAPIITRRSPAHVLAVCMIIVSLCVLAAFIRRSDAYGAAEG